MAKETSGLFSVPITGHKESMDLLQRLTDVARPDVVYSEPVTVGEHTVITASEVSASLGYGYGIGGGSEPAVAEAEGSEAQAERAESSGGGFGGGGGGGGVASARPVAVIHISPEGVRVEPVVDVTKVSLAFFTMLGSIFVLASKMRRGAGKL